MQVDDLNREQRKAESDVEQVRMRRGRDQKRLDSGSGSPKDLERLQHELVSLDRRIAELEDLELEVMARLEDAQLDLQRRHNDIARLDAEIEELSAARTQSLEALRSEAAQVRQDREAAIDGMPVDLMSLYERLREQKDGVGAALLRARRCGGCSLELNSAELAEIAQKAPDEVVRCDECSRILVRTEESGL